MNHELLKLLDLDQPFLAPDVAKRLATIVVWFPPVPRDRTETMSADYEAGFREAINLAAAVVLAAGGVADSTSGCAPVASPPFSGPAK